MQKEKRNNLAIYTLAGSILLSSVIVSMSQVNAHSTSASKRELTVLKNCIVNFQKDTADLIEMENEWFEEGQRIRLYDAWPGLVPDEYKDYIAGGPNLTSGWMYWIADNLEC